MPIPKFNRALVVEIAQAAGVSEEAVWISSTDSRIRVCFWTERMTMPEVNKLTGRKRFSLVSFLQDFNADGYLTKVHPSEAQTRDLHPLKITHEGRKYCSATGCEEVLYTVAELYIGQCELCVSPGSFC